MKNLEYKKISIFLLAFSIVSLPFIVSAATSGGVVMDKGLVPDCNVGPLNSKGVYEHPCNFTYFIELINNVIEFLLFKIATPLAALIITYAGFKMVTSGGNAETATQAKSIAKNLVIGYVMALAAWLIVRTVFTTLQVNIDPASGGIDTHLQDAEKK
jgi:Type IV secretion system pilin